MANKIDISCIIVSYNCLSSLKDCVESLAIQSGISFETIIIDNASVDDSANYISSIGGKNKLLARNIGFGAAVNIAAMQADGRFLFIINPDTILPTDALKQIYEFAAEQSEFGIIAPTLVYPDGRTQLSARNLPNRREFLFGRGSPVYKFGFTSEKNAGYIVPQDNNPLEVPAVSATAIFIESKLFSKLGGFDERYFMYLEDIDLCRKIRESGLKIFILPAIKITHQWRKSSQSRPLISSYHHHISVYKYFHKHYPSQWYYNVPLGVVLSFGFCLSCLGRLIGRR